MVHSNNSKVETVHLRIDNGLGELLELISNKDPKSDFCKSKLANTFMIYGIVTAFSEDIEYDLSNLEWVIKNMKKTENKINGILNRVHAGKNSKE